MTNVCIRVAFTLLAIFFCADASAQSRRSSPVRRNVPAFGVIKVFAGGGISYYMGDMRAKTDLRFIQPHLALGVSYRLAERIALRGEVDIYRISGKQAGGPIWYNNLSFRSDNPAGYIGLQIDAFRYNDERLLKPYLLGGIGMTRINPKANYQGNWHSLPPLMTEGVAYKRNVRIAVIGVGVSWKHDDRWNFAVELSDNFANSDYLDDVSTNYPNPGGMSELALALSDRRPELTNLPSGYSPQNEPGNQRGNPKVKDSYGFLSFRAEYLLGTQARRAERRKLRCYY
ncbi:hypothetical protein GVN20_24995 [Runella sp. CRIBMP]|uniref:hypothetical protein n=1 Tax=Runella sp. CRIBMP TaxID=2683261 RepID=UPI00141233CF|nr:hypothetical protein [Runella sp. CRIBMP]NBB22636.1 hypothetical protein [Runella sp. CRIBMP]